MQGSMIHYFAYGSNLHPLRLQDRIPSACLIGAVECTGQILRFHKKGADGSGKCNLVKTADSTAVAYGAIFSLLAEDKAALDRFEGKGFGYVDEQIRLQHNNHEYTCFTYIAQSPYITDSLRPYHWYKNLVILGADYLEFPRAYVDSIRSIESQNDPDSCRTGLNEKLINRMTQHQNQGETCQLYPYKL